MFQSLSREKPFCHHETEPALVDQPRFQSLSREKPFCHLLYQNAYIYRTRVSIAQSRKALLPQSSARGGIARPTGFNRSVAKSPSATSHREQANVDVEWFQSLSREKPFCHQSITSGTPVSVYSFNRSVAKSPSATAHSGSANQ